MPKFSLELDCAPGTARPGEHLPAVIRGTVLEGKLDPNKPNGCCFGNWRWEYELDEEEHENLKPILAHRITALYNQGAIRYGSW
jgi:hypothetical protein